jgi:hypothetical protein
MGLAVVTALAGIVMTARSLAGLSQTVESYRKRTADIREVTALRNRMQVLRALVAERERQGGAPAPVTDLLQAVLPNRAVTTRQLDAMPTLPGWTAQRVSVVLTDIAGDELGRLLQEAARRQPAWTPLDGTLLASSTPGRLAKVELTLMAVGRTGK